MKKSYLIVLVLMLCLFISSAGYGANKTVEWIAPTLNADGSPCTDLAGYKLYYGKVSGSYTNNIAIGLVESYTVTIDNTKDGETYYFVMTAIDTSGNESALSNEISYTIPDVAPQSITIKFR